MNYSIRAFVIAVDGLPRNSSLIDDLKNVELFSEVNLVNAITPLKYDANSISDLVDYAQVLLGRVIDPIEICIALSHYQVYLESLKYKDDIFLILEDDANVINMDDFKESLRNLNVTSKSTIWTFYSPKWSVWRKVDNERKACFPPPYALAYAINRSALETARSNLPIGLADWPTWSKFVNFKLLNNSGIDCLENFSFVDDLRKFNLTQKFTFRSLFTMRFFKIVPLSDRFKYIILYKIIWKFFNLFRTDNKYPNSILID